MSVNRPGRLGRNSPCPCKSGKKFKACCLPKLSMLGNCETERNPYLNFPITVHTCLTVVSNSIETSKRFWPISVVGRSRQAVEFDASSEELEHDQILRVGFCNCEYRLIAQAKTDKGVFELRANDVLRPGVHVIFVVFDNQENLIKLFVDGQMLESKVLDGELAFSSSDQISIASGQGLMIWFTRIYRQTFDESDLSGCRAIQVPKCEDWWNREANAISRLYFPGEAGTLVHSWISLPYLGLIRGRTDLVRRVLEAFNDTQSNYNTPQEACKAASLRISELTSALRAIIDDPSSDEPALLKFIERTPQIAFLLEPDSVKQWREQTLQGYGRIDFVFELVDRSYCVMEIESHNASLFTIKDELRAEVSHALSQVEKWLLGAEKLPHVTQRNYGVSGAEHFSGCVVIGRSKDIDTEFRSDRWLATRRSRHKILTWDDILARGQRLAQRLSDPAVAESSWE
ncbi:MAG: DUF4263 domain-containing protein [Pirellulaceae bacterium]|nr:DUF4263 domain-containing protein [Pirellulaceae bacterium]